MKNKLYEAAKAVLYGWASRLTRPRSEWNEKLQALADAISAYEQEQPEAMDNLDKISSENIDPEIQEAVNKRFWSMLGPVPEAIAVEKTIIEIWKEWCEKDISWTDAALGAMRDFTSQQTSAKDKEIAELKQRISELEKLR